MKKIVNKIALIALVAVSLIFVVTSMLYALIPTMQPQEVNNTTVVIFVMLLVIYVTLAVYLVYSALADNGSIKNVLIRSDSDSAVYITSGSIKKTVASCAKKVPEVKVRKIQILSDEKMGFQMRLEVDVKASSVKPVVEKIKALVADSFNEIYELKFSNIEIRVRKMVSNYVPKQTPDKNTPENGSQQPEVVAAAESAQQSVQSDTQGQQPSRKHIYGEPQSGENAEVVVEIADENAARDTVDA